ncbi:uncharacterized protein LOC121774422 [Salvia splendens]|uniref:uncharacterized protein LOC121774422 n=1 Tax=Salvia splendens TaxID=180675 RepID=UPI001C2576CC|nr:uncharacterized protein LOC121774422 [Salvia splendens]
MGSWNPGRQRDAPWRNHLNFRWSDNDPNQPPPQQNTQLTQQPERQTNWSGRNQEGQSNWNNQNQGDHSNWGNRDQTQGNSYVPPHQRNYTGYYQNSQPPYQGNQGPGNQFHNTSGGQGNFRPSQGSGPHLGTGPSSGHASSKTSKNLDDMLEQKAAMDMLAKQLSQIATSLSEIRGNEGKIPASVRPPDRSNISQITLRSGKRYDGPLMKMNEETPATEGEKRKNPVPEPENSKVESTLRRDDIREGKLDRPLTRETEPFFLDPEPEAEKELAGEKMDGVPAEGSARPGRQLKSFPHRGETKKKKDEPVDFMDIFGKLEINLPFLQALKLLVFSRLTKESCICPEGVLENVIVKEHDFMYPADFHVIKMRDNESAESSGVLLGRPLLRTAKTIIDVFDGTICLDYNGEKYTFSIDEAMKKPLDVENLHAIDVINPLVQEFLETELMQELMSNSESSHSIDMEVAGWCEAMHTRELSDEELAEAISEFCTNPGAARSRGSAYVANLESTPGIGKGMKSDEENNPLP